MREAVYSQFTGRIGRAEAAQLNGPGTEALAGVFWL
jgi:hypothetical protein